MIWNVSEYAATIIEYLIYADFMIRFLSVKKKAQLIPCYIGIAFANIVVTLVLNQFMLFEGYLCFIRIGINFTTAILFLRGTTYEKIFASFSTDISVLLINFITLSILGSIFQKNMTELIAERGILRIFILFVTKFLFFLCTRFLINIKKNDRYQFHVIEWLSISAVFLGTLFVEIEVVLMALSYDIDMNSSFFITIGVSLILINVFLYFLIRKIGQKNQENAELLIDKIQLEFYRSQLSESQSQYKEMKKLRHDIKNHLQCLSALIYEKSYCKAQAYLTDILENKLDFGYANIKTSNQVVDAIVNTKLSVCNKKNIKTTVHASPFELNINDVDICIVLGNLFDNAIEACEKIDGERLIYFEILQKKSYVNITIRNTTKGNTIAENPNLKTTKRDKTLHGFGITAIKEIVEKYNGMVEIHEENANFYVNIWLPSGKTNSKITD